MRQISEAKICLIFPQRAELLKFGSIATMCCFKFGFFHFYNTILNVSANFTIYSVKNLKFFILSLPHEFEKIMGIYQLLPLMITTELVSDNKKIFLADAYIIESKFTSS